MKGPCFEWPRQPSRHKICPAALVPDLCTILLDNGLEAEIAADAGGIVVIG
jgi:hypothetical protein